RTVLAARGRHHDPIEAVVSHTRGTRLIAGKVVDIERRTTDGFLRGVARVAGLDADRGHELVLEFQNEFVMSVLDGRPSVMTPEIICVMDTEAGDAIGTETLRYGQRVTVVALPCAPILMTPKGLTLVGPRAFGYPVDFRPVCA